MKLFSIFKRKKRNYNGLIDFINRTTSCSVTNNVSLTSKTLSDLILSLRMHGFDNQSLSEDLRVTNIRYNGCEDKMRKLFRFEPTRDIIPKPTVYAISGYPCHPCSWVPLGEMWMCNSKGAPIKRVKLL